MNGMGLIHALCGIFDWMPNMKTDERFREVENLCDVDVWQARRQTDRILSSRETIGLMRQRENSAVIRIQ
jgi:hypothetical protein